MRSLVALLVAAACALARPPGPDPTAQSAQGRSLYRRPSPHTRQLVGDFFYDRFMYPHLPNDPEPSSIDYEWFKKEIDRIHQMHIEERATPNQYTRWTSQDPSMQGYNTGIMREEPVYDQRNIIPNPIRSQLPVPQKLISPENPSHEVDSKEHHADQVENDTNERFALTPLDDGYFEAEASEENSSPSPDQEHAIHEGGEQKPAMELQPPRHTRQNPLSKSKTLVAENLDRLRSGLAHEDGVSTDKPRHLHVLETSNDPADSIYGVALIAAVGIAVTMAVFGFVIGWYTLFKRAKAAADVDYPAYGVTGPTVDSSGDRKLAHSAHMYHYQHQKQQIIAMERNGLEQRNGSVSDPESEEENEEGDYTVYECPGFATTGDMEVKNPLFTEEPTPATPGKCKVVKPQPKD